MAKNKSKINTSKLILAVAIVLIAAFVTIFVFRAISHSSVNDDSTEPSASSEENQSQQEVVPPAELTDEERAELGPPAQYEGSDVNSSDTLSGSLAYAFLSSGTVTLGANVDQFLSSGTCQITFGGQSTTVNIEPSVTTSSCTATLSGFSSGTYSYTITLKSGDKTGTITGEVSI